MRTNHSHLHGNNKLSIKVFTVLFVIEVIILLSVLFQIGNKNKLIWPPPEGKPNRLYWIIFIFYSLVIGSVWLCVLEWRNTLFGSVWIRDSGLILLLTGLGLYIWCRRYMSKKVEFGGKDHLITQGPYQYTRNPLYIADTFIFLGFALISNSLLVMILMVVLITTLLLLPFIEEAWLLEQYGEQYKNYMKKVPRYIRI